MLLPNAYTKPFHHIKQFLELKLKSVRFELTAKVTLLLAVLMIFVSLISVFVIYQLSLRALKDEIKRNLTETASSVASVVDAEMIKQIRTRDDIRTVDYQTIHAQLRRFQKAFQGRVRYIYIIGKRGSSYIYLVDAQPVGSRDFSWIGTIFPIREYPDAIRGFSKPAVDREPILDKEFNIVLQSGYAPIRDKTGSTVGMVGIDVDISNLNREKGEMVRGAVVAVLIAVMLAALLGIFFAVFITRPILILTEGTKNIAAGDFTTAIHLERSDELGTLAASFNTMTSDLRRMHDQLEQANLDLEEKVKERTDELTVINRELKDILDNMSEGIFTIDENLLLNPQHSRAMAGIFGRESFKGMNILSLFFPLAEQKEARLRMADWLDQVFHNMVIGWEDLEMLQPVSEITIPVKEIRGKESLRYIQIGFRPIVATLGPDDPGRVVKVMVIVRDNTDQKNLEIEMEKKQQEYQDNLAQIIEIVKLDQELFRDFINECQNNLLRMEPKILSLNNEQNKELLSELFRTVHTIKGNARQFKLEKIAGEAHHIESILASFQKSKTAINQESIEELLIRLDHFRSLFNETEKILAIIQSREIDTGRTRSERRSQEENDTLKIKTEDFHLLEELMARASCLASERTEDQTALEANRREMAEIIEKTTLKMEMMRRVKMGRLFTRFPRMVRDISRELGKNVRLVVRGEDTMVDKSIFDKIGDPLIHILRNALDHGIEKSQERVLMGKSPEGTIEVNVSQSETELMVEVKDDGRGIDLEILKEKAVFKGIITADQAAAMTETDALEMIYYPGFSTNEYLTNISGRGIGMDVVQTMVKKQLNGTLEIHTEKGRGFDLVMKIPVHQDAQ